MQEYRRIAVRSRSGEMADRVVAEVWSAGASGVEERETDEGDTWLLVYAPAESAEAVRRAAVATLDGAGEVQPGIPVADVDWSIEWKRGIAATVVSERLIVRPSFVAQALGPGQRELVIDPGQAFGTGGHASTLLALEWVDALAAVCGGSLPGSRVLDVGTGTGVLALSALRLGAARAVGCDLDPVAVREAVAVARQNDLDAGLRVFVGSLAALRAAPFDLVVANLLRREVLPIATRLSGAVRRGGLAVLSGLLATDVAEVERAFLREGLSVRGSRSHRDTTGDVWASLLLERPDA